MITTFVLVESYVMVPFDEQQAEHIRTLKHALFFYACYGFCLDSMKT